MRRISLALGAFAVFAVAPHAARAQATLGPVLAYHNTADFGIGASLSTSIAALDPAFGLQADFVYYFPNAGNYWELNGNLTYDFPLAESTAVPFVLAGLNIAHASALGLGDTQLGLNVGGGIAFDLGTFRPSVSAKFEIDGGDEFVLWATLPFALGGSN